VHLEIAANAAIASSTVFDVPVVRTSRTIFVDAGPTLAILRSVPPGSRKLVSGRSSAAIASPARL